MGSQQGKEIIKTVLLCLLRESVTLKSLIDTISGAGMFCATFLTRRATAALELGWPCSQVGSASLRAWGRGGKEARSGFAENTGVFSPSQQLQAIKGEDTVAREWFQLPG